MSDKVLLVASVASMIQQFNMRNIDILLQMGYQVEVACNFAEGNTCAPEQIGELKKELESKQVVWHQIDFARNVFKLGQNARAYRQLKELFKKNQYHFVHCHSPIGGVLGRLAAHKYKTRAIYTAHGFHFFKGAALKNWLLYYPMERLLSSFTDAVVTINDEDFERAKKLNLAHGNIFHIDGVGVNLERFHPISKIEKHEIRKKIGLRDSDFVVLYVAQFIPRKNHQLIIHQIQNIVKTVPDFKVVFAGNGETLLQCKTLAEQMGVSKYIMFLGGRSDIPDLCGMADIHVSPSLQEGLAIGNIEAMATGCPLVLSNIRGHREVCRDGINGYLFDLNDPQKMTDSIIVLFQDKERYELIKATNLHDVHKFSVDCSVKSMAGIYKSVVE